ncbi:MAG: Gfo/Idh/MocA family oxidoreductase [Planctomycetaceae bacterium]
MSPLNRRDFLHRSLATSAAIAWPTLLSEGSARAAEPNDEIGVGMIGAGGRAGELSKGFHGPNGAKVVAVTDPDEGRATRLAKNFDAKVYSDLHKLLEDPAVDVVVVATCNHWHCLAAIWAMQAGKDVYVEKPLSHTQWEGRQVVAAARKYKKVVQLGTQQRSDPLQSAIKKFLHEDQALGKIHYAQANRLGQRAPIGKLDKPLEIPAGVNYDLWLGPAADEPLYRKQFHYDWHWDWNTGSGEMGNWGVHVLDDVRNVAYQDSVTTPKRILAVGGRVAWDDAGNTPNCHYVYFDTGSFPTLIALSNVEAGPGKKGNWSTKGNRPFNGPSTGYLVACEGGYYAGGRGGGKAFDLEGKEIRSFKGGSMDTLHKANFINAVRSRDWESPNAEIAIGHDSSGWCNLANVAFRAGKNFSMDEAKSIQPDFEPWNLLLGELGEHLGRFDIPLSSAEIRMSPVLHHDPKTEKFTGDHAESANAFLKREYRKGYEVPEIV